jgi:hypothetical protein
MTRQSVRGLAKRSCVLDRWSTIGRETGCPFLLIALWGTLYQAPHPVMVLTSDIPMDRKSERIAGTALPPVAAKPNQRLICARIAP